MMPHHHTQSSLHLMFLTALPLIFVLCITYVPGSANAAEKESVYDRVMRTGEIRCGYGVIDPYLMKDPNTGEFSGIYYDYMTLVGEALNLKIVWTEEVGWGDYVAGLKQGRFDAFCTICWPSAERARETDFISPVVYNKMDIYVRADDNRFDNAVKKANNADVRVVSVEGQTPHKTALQNLPDAKHVVLPQIVSSADVFIWVADGKADLTFAESIFADNYMRNNPGNLKKLPGSEAVRYAPNGLSIKAGEWRLKRLLDITTEELHTTGQIDAILDKYESKDGLFYRKAKPYQLP